MISVKLTPQLRRTLQMRGPPLKSARQSDTFIRTFTGACAVRAGVHGAGSDQSCRLKPLPRSIKQYQCIVDHRASSAAPFCFCMKTIPNVYLSTMLF
ncbi:hypothetical protein EVAR_44346_1 [Eumeta japonica]|uniref:Uncharacterized protein n=1 Tax=Eumeta variegata TaxID=151549 RepID=A0A4C1X5Q2_EUMVA|nr:hypothetical protein EVAR_44346_1 [Eumeta japonica]